MSKKITVAKAIELIDKYNKRQEFIKCYGGDRTPEQYLAEYSEDDESPMNVCNDMGIPIEELEFTKVQQETMYQFGQYVFNVPTVDHKQWSRQDWINYIDLNNGWRPLPMMGAEYF